MSPTQACGNSFFPFVMKGGRGDPGDKPQVGEGGGRCGRCGMGAQPTYQISICKWHVVMLCTLLPPSFTTTILARNDGTIRRHRGVTISVFLALPRLPSPPDLPRGVPCRGKYSRNGAGGSLQDDRDLVCMLAPGKQASRQADKG